MMITLKYKRKFMIYELLVIILHVTLLFFFFHEYVIS